jgi:hypothetical protein
MDYGTGWPVLVGRDERAETRSAASDLNARLLELDLHVIESIFFLGTRGLIGELASVI